jgi:glucose/arabinose dehydrogenase
MRRSGASADCDGAGIAGSDASEPRGAAGSWAWAAGAAATSPAVKIPAAIRCRAIRATLSPRAPERNPTFADRGGAPYRARMPRTPALLVVALGLFAAAAPASAARLSGQRLGTFDEPVHVASPPADPRTQAVVQRYGLIRLVRRGRVLRRPLLDLRSRVRIDDDRETVDQRGLLSIAFAPDYARSGRFYVDYVDRDGRLRVDVARRGSRRTHRILDLGVATTMHHGGQLQFGRDGLLYVSTGMADEPAASQDPGDPRGKLLRLDPRDPDAPPELVALGLRNPWRFSFDRATGLLWIGDVGGSRREEIDVLDPAAAGPVNFGWPFAEGRTARPGAPPGLRPPALTHPHGPRWCSIVGGHVVRGRGPRALRGRYLYGDVCSGDLWSARVSGLGLGRPRRAGVRVPYLVSFGEDARGRIYAVSLGGAVWRLRG